MSASFLFNYYFFGSVLNDRRTMATVIRNTNIYKNGRKEISALVALVMRLGSQHAFTLLSNCPFSRYDLKKNNCSYIRIIEMIFF